MHGALTNEVIELISPVAEAVDGVGWCQAGIGLVGVPIAQQVDGICAVAAGTQGRGVLAPVVSITAKAVHQDLSQRSTAQHRRA